MRAVLLLPCLFVACTSTQPESAVTLLENDAVRVIEVSFRSAAIDDVLQYRAIVPKTPASQKLPVLYFLHGANSGPAQVMEMSEIVSLAAEKQLVVILPDGKFSYYTNACNKWHQNWEDAMTEDLLQDAEKRFPVEPGREHRGLAGLSMGGYGAAKIGLDLLAR